MVCADVISFLVQKLIKVSHFKFLLSMILCCYDLLQFKVHFKVQQIRSASIYFFVPKKLSLAAMLWLSYGCLGLRWKLCILKIKKISAKEVCIVNLRYPSAFLINKLMIFIICTSVRGFQIVFQWGCYIFCSNTYQRYLLLAGYEMKDLVTSSFEMIRINRNLFMLRLK